MLQKQIKDLKEFDIKTLQTQIQFDLKDLGQEVKSLRERLQTAPDKEELESQPRTSEDRFKASTRQLQEDRQALWASKKESTDGPEPAVSRHTPPHLEKQSSNVLRGESLIGRGHRIQSLGIGEEGDRNRDKYMDQEEVHRIIHPKDYPKNEQFPRFSGEGTYDLYGFIAKIEMIRKDFQMVDQTILARMSLILDGQAALWYETQREEYDQISWDQFKQNLLDEYDTLTWQKRVAYEFEKDKFFPHNVGTPSAWVVRQAKRVKIMERQATNRQIIHKILLRFPGSIVNLLDGRISTESTIHQFNQLFVSVVENSNLTKEAKDYLAEKNSRRTQTWSTRGTRGDTVNKPREVVTQGA